MSGVEIRGRIVEREVAVLADADERDVDRRLRELAADARRRVERIPLGIEQVVVANAGLVDQALAQVLAKARGMVDRQADVLVEMEHLDAATSRCRPAPVSASRKSNCDAPVAATIRARPLAASVERSTSAACRAAARLMVGRSV